MDTADLLQVLRARIEATTRDHDSLADAVSALTAEIARQRGEYELVQNLVTRFEVAPPTSNAKRVPPATARDAERPEPTSANGIAWPTGPGYSKKIRVKKIKAWARFKLASADWYLSTLRTMHETGEFSRVLGLEMAIDGIIQSLCGVFEASVFALTIAVERAAKIPEDRRTPVHLASWSNLAAEAKYLDIDLASSLSVSDALIGEHSVTPQGWLAQLIVLRQRSTRQDLLVDHRLEEGKSSELCIDVPGRGPRPVLSYLTETRDLIEELLETMMHDIEDAKQGRIHVTGTDILRQRAEREISDLLSSGDSPQ